MRNLKLFFLVSVMLIGISNAWAGITEVNTFSATSGKLDNYISYRCAKGNGTSAPAIINNDGQIRLYQNANGATGGYIVISAIDGCTLTEVTIGSAMQTTIGYIKTNPSSTPDKNTFDVSNYSLAANKTYTVQNIGTQHITFACFGTTDKTRLYINYLKVTYETPTEETYIVSWYVNGEPYYTTPSVEKGSRVTLPAPPDDDYMVGCDANKFMGWSSTNIVNGPLNGTAVNDLKLFTDRNNAPIITEDTKFYAVFATATINESSTTTENVSDVLNNGNTIKNATSTTYTNWTTKGTSGAVYSGNSAGSNNSIQLRGTKPSEIVTTTSEGKVKSVSVVWNTSTSAGRTLDIYGKNTAYQTTGSDGNLYNNTTQGTKLGSIVYDTSTSFEIPGDYQYIGLRSNSSAMYLNSITIEWEQTKDSEPTTTYSNYITSCLAEPSCEDKVTLRVSATGQGQMSWDGSAYSNTLEDKELRTCAENNTINLYLQPADNYTIGEVTDNGTALSPTTAGGNIYLLSYNKGETGIRNISITFTEKPKYTITYFINGKKEEKENVYEGTNILSQLPTTPEACDPTSNTFIGWTTAEIKEKQPTAPDEIISETEILNGDLTLYALFAEETGKEKIQVPVTRTALDVLTNSNTINEVQTGDKNTPSIAYKEWETKDENLRATYKGRTAGEDGTIQLRTRDDNEGIICTKSGGNLMKINVYFNSEKTTIQRTLDVYVSNSEYIETANLYDTKNNKAGTNIISFEVDNNDSKTLNQSYSFEKSYQYIGFRSRESALYLDKIEIEWEYTEEETVEVPAYSNYITTCEKKVMVTWSVDGDDSNYAEYGENETVVVPEVVGCKDNDGRVFVGWVSEEITTTNEAPKFIDETILKAVPKEDVTYYAVFANKNGGKIVDTRELKEDFEIYNAPNSYTNTNVEIHNESTGLSWSMDYASVSTSKTNNVGPIGNQYVLFKVDKEAPAMLRTIGSVADLISISLYAAKAAAPAYCIMSWSSDKQNWSSEKLNIGSTSERHYITHDFNIPQNLYIRFSTGSEDKNITDKNPNLSIDDIVFTIAKREYFYTDYSLECNSVSRNITWKDGNGNKLDNVECEPDGDKLILPALSKENYLFKGWKAEIDETDYSEIYAAGDLYIVNHKVTFTALWERYIESVINDIAPITSYVDVSTQSATTGYIKLVSDADASVLAKPQAVIINKEDGEVNSHFTVVPGDYDETNHGYPFTVAYKPTDKNYNRIEKATIYFTFGNVLQTEAIEVSARSLPEKFVIAVKIPDSDQWVALPNDLKGTQNDQKRIVPVGIVVDNPDCPTKANIVPENAIYTACERYTTNGYTPNPATMRFTIIDSNNKRRYLQVTNSSSDDAKTVMWLSDTGGQNVQNWYLKSDESFGPYSLTIPDNAVPEKQMGMIDNLYMGYSLEPANADIYILPFVSVLDIVPTEVTEWGKNSVIVAPSGISNIQSAKVRMGSGTEQEPISIEAINGNLGGTKNIKITTEFDFSKSENQTLYIDWYDADKLISSSQIIVPLVIAEDYAISSDNKYKNWTEREVHVLPNATLSTGRFTNNYVEINKVVVYPNATLQVDKELRITDFCLNNGWSRTGEKSFYGAANVFLNFDDYPNKEDVKLSATTAYIDLDLFERVGSSMQTHYYSFAVPCSVAVKDIKYADTSLDGIAQYGQHYVIKRYDSESRATSGMNHDNNNWVPVEDTDTEILEPGKGYIITALSVGGEAKLRIPLDKMDWSAINTSVKVSKYTSTSANKSDAGWNMIAVHGQNKAKVTNGVNYLTVPTIEFDKYQQADISEFDVMPGYGFFVQVNASEDAAEPDPIEFKFIKPGSASSNTAKSIIARRVAREKDIRMRLVLENEQESDRTTILTGEDYTTDYEIGYDLEKMFGDGNCLQVYTLSAGSRLAFNALPTDALQDIPVGYIAPKAGEYMFTIPEDYDTSGVEGIYLTDKVEERTYDLMWTDYVFNTQAGTNNNRFTLWLKVKAPETTTNIDNGGNNEWGVQAIGMEKNIMLRNLPLGADVYVLSMDGKLVNSVKKVSNSRANIPVSMLGVYNVRVMQGKEAITLKVIVR